MKSQISRPDRFLKTLLRLESIRREIDQKCPDRKPEILTFRDVLVRGPLIRQARVRNLQCLALT